MKEVKITCDNCNIDLTCCGQVLDYRLNLLYESIPSNSMVISNSFEPPLPTKDNHFCGVGCLKKRLEDK